MSAETLCKRVTEFGFKLLESTVKNRQAPDAESDFARSEESGLPENPAWPPLSLQYCADAAACDSLGSGSRGGGMRCDRKNAATAASATCCARGSISWWMPATRW